MNGKGLGGVCEVLELAGIPSTTGASKWGRSVVNNILTKGCYMKGIVSEEDFFEAQFEREQRSNINQDTGKRKTGRYSSQNVLDGLLVCSECGSNYRRITTHSGNAVWRCANRIEHGGEICKHSPTISESEVIGLICKRLSMEVFDESQVRQKIDRIEILAGTSPAIFHKEQQCVHQYEMSLL